MGCLERCLRWADVCENVCRTLCCQCDVLFDVAEENSVVVCVVVTLLSEAH